MKTHHANVALFIPHAGCPHRCSFCNQRTIAGQQKLVTAADVAAACETAAATMKVTAGQAEIAFFGGSFTAIPREYMLSLLQAAAPYVERGCFSGIRCSTRPDAIDEEILALLKEYHVTTIELGAQCMDDRVLSLNERGHTVQQVIDAASLIHESGIVLGLQMMTGLYGSSDAADRRTAEQFISLHPDCVRIYPTIVVEGTKLAELYEQGLYVPPTLEQAVALCAELLTLFEQKHRIPVIRLGLHAEESLTSGMIAGPWHPAFRELCESRILLSRVTDKLSQAGNCREATVLVNPRDVSKMIGQKKLNLQRFAQMGYSVTVKSDERVSQGYPEIECRK